MTKYFYIPYSCLGDLISESPIAHYLHDEKGATHVIMLCTFHTYKTALHLFSDFPYITPYPVPSDYHFYLEKLKFKALSEEARDGYELIALGNFGDNPDFLKLDILDLNCLYLQHGIPKEARFTHFRLPSNLVESERRYTELVNKIGKEYILIHDDPSRILVLNYDKVYTWLKEHDMLNIPVVYLGKNRYQYKLIEGLNTPDVGETLNTDDALDFVHILRGAKACHMMDSSFAILLDYVADPNLNQKRVSYKRQHHKDTRHIYHIEWEFEDTRTMTNEFDPPPALP